MRKTILIFGAGINQLELIKAAKELNVVTVVIDPMINPPGKKYADYYYQVEGNDYDSTKRIANAHNVGGIVTAQMENPLHLMARLAEEIGCIFNSSEIIAKSRNKFLMKQAFIKNAVPCAHGVVINEFVTIDSAFLQASKLSFPLIIKPIDSHSSRGVYKIEKLEDLISHTKETAVYSSNRDCLIEEFLDGREFSVEAITFQGDTHIVQFTEKIITPYPRAVEMGHIQPANLTNKEKDEMEVIAKKAINALGIDNTATHTELKITNDSIKVVEIGARLGGDFISSYLTKTSTGVNMDKAAVQIALGIKPDIYTDKKQYAFIKYVDLPVGKKVIEVLPINDLLLERDIIFAHIFIKPGDVIKEIVHSGQRPACIIISGENLEQVKERAEMVSCLIKSKYIKTE